MTSTQAGQPAPTFTLPNAEGKMISLADLKGSYVLIYFYPKALTPGCTTQACSLRDGKAELAEAGVTVLGISKDKPSLLKKFIEKESLNFDLLSDETHEVAESYGVWQKKSLYGREYMGMARSTFLIDKQGLILHVWPKANPKTQAEDVLTWLRKNT